MDQPKTFKFNNLNYRYFFHTYNAINNERAIEVPIIYTVLDWFRKLRRGCRILEVGNVLSHYFEITHDIIDKYEEAPTVINEDILTYNPPDKYDLIISISTLEHVGWDEKPKEPPKVLLAMRRLNSLMREPDGQIYVTIPFGYNRVLDRYFWEEKIRFDEEFFMVRTNKENEWIQTFDRKLVRTYKYGNPYPCANAILIGVNYAAKNSSRLL